MSLVVGTGKRLGFTDYQNVSTPHNDKVQRLATARIEQPRDLCYLMAHVKGLFEIASAVSALHKGLNILVLDILHQDFTKGGDGATNFSWHQDTDKDNNPGGQEIIRTVIVKLTKGPSAMQIAGLNITKYGEEAGSFVDFRADAYHRSVVIPSTDHFKLVFFLGHREILNDGRKR